MYQDLILKNKQVAVIGLGYVGLPLALEFAKYFKVIGFDINENRVKLMQQKVDPSNELSKEDFNDRDIVFTSNLEVLSDGSVFVIAVPTDIDEHKVPNLTPLKKASETVGKVIKKGDIVIYESTVYPGCTEEDCIPIIEKNSGLKFGTDFFAGYSPERINPGDKTRPLASILKIVSGSDENTLEEVSNIYGHVIKAGIYKAQSIKVAEAAKVIENTQRDLNISLMNELSIIFDQMGIDTKAVIEAAGTKWNFIKLYPGLVGGHCIGVDPYYLLHKSRELGYEPQVIAAGRRVNDGMPSWIAKKLVQMLIDLGKSPKECKVLVKGITFKEDVSDVRNSKVADLVYELKDYSITVEVTDPFASKSEVEHEYGFTLVDSLGNDYDAVVVAVAHSEYKLHDEKYFKDLTNNNLVLIDLKGIYTSFKSIQKWSL
jgi:UDP-N-acetyl-D-galactosamine dehydrogenase